MRGFKRTLLNNKGVGLAGVLVASTITLVVLGGVYRVSDISVSNAKIFNTIFAEQDLKRAIGQSLIGNNCKENLKQFHSTTGPFSLNNLQAGGMTLVTKGSLFKQRLNIRKLEFRKTPEKLLTVYYSKAGLGDQETLPKQDGTAGVCTATDQSDCYFISCKVDYKCDDQTCTKGCESLNCATTQEFASVKTIDTKAGLKGVKCDDGKYLKGFDSDGGKICVDLQETNTLPTGSCPDGQVLKGFDAEGNRDCISVTCPNAGEFLKGFDENGRPDCRKPCYGGQIYYESIDLENPVGGLSTAKYKVGSSFQPYPGEVPVENTRKRFCECPANKPDWNGEKCRACTSDQRWVESENACMLCTGGDWEGSRCVCPSGYIKKKVG